MAPRKVQAKTTAGGYRACSAATGTIRRAAVDGHLERELALDPCDQVRRSDLDEARSRLRRLALIWELRLRSPGSERLDASEGDAWTLRQVAFCP